MARNTKRTETHPLSVMDESNIATIEADSAKQEADSAKREADSAKQEADSAKREADIAKQEADFARATADSEIKNAANETTPAQTEGSCTPGRKNDLIRIDEHSDYVLEESETAIKLSESARRNAELARDRAEDTRTGAEDARSTAEHTRRGSEQEREYSDKLKNKALTAKELAEKALREALEAKQLAQLSDERYRLVLEGSGDGVFDWDLEKHTVYWSGRFFEMLGFHEKISPSEKEIYELIHPDDKQKCKEAICQVLSHTERFEEEFRIQRIESDYIYCSVRGKTKINKKGEPIRVSGTITDITQRKVIEAELEKAKEFAELANKRKSQAISNLSHEFKNPLNAVIGFSEMLTNQSKAPFTEKHAKYLKNIQQSGYHMLQMVNDILDIARIEAGKVELFPEWVLIEPQVHQAIAMVNNLALNHKIHLNIDIQTDIGEAEIDPLRVRQILINLISNAIKFSKEGQGVEIQVTKSEDQQWVIFKVSDKGIGIPEDRLLDVFIEFYQLTEAPTVRKKEGHGLGLPLSKRLADIHGGSISVESKVGEGSVFELKIPVTFPGNP